jgi:hypothetical protein
MPARSSPSAGALALGIRAITAIIGGYALTAALTSLIARLLPGARSEASAWALNISFVVYVAILLWVFTSRELPRTVGIIWGGALLLTGVLWLAGARA